MSLKDYFEENKINYWSIINDDYLREIKTIFFNQSSYLAKLLIDVLKNHFFHKISCVKATRCLGCFVKLFVISALLLIPNNDTRSKRLKNGE